MSDRMDGYEGEVGASASPQPALVASLPEPVCAVSAHAGDGQAQGVRRNWRGQFIKRLRHTPPGSREWLIWSHYHRAWHCRDEEGRAAGYSTNIADAGIFDRAKADSYNDGDRNEAFHVSEKADAIRAAMSRLETSLANLRLASVDERPKGQDPAEGLGATPASAVPSEETADAQTRAGPSHDK